MEEERIEQEDGTAWRQVVSNLVGEIGTLVRQEADLARCEFSEKAQLAKRGATSMGTGGALALIGAFTLAIAAVLGLTLLLVQWMSPIAAAFVSSLVVGAVLAGVGFILIKRGGEQLSPDHLMPRRTLESIKEDARWVRKQV